MMAMIKRIFRFSAAVTELESGLLEAPVDESAGQQCSTPITKLPPEMLVEIFSYLHAADKGRTAQVCKTWRDTVYTQRLWRNDWLNTTYRQHDDDFMERMAMRGIRHVLHTDKTISLHDVVASFQQLKQLIISTDSKDTEKVAEMKWTRAITANPMTNLTRLGTINRMADTSVATIATNLASLKVLELFDCTKLTDDALLSIGRTLPRLTTLLMYSCSKITDAGIYYVAGSNPNISAGNRKLELLSIHNAPKLTDDSLRHIGKELTNLVSILIHRCIKMTDAGFTNLANLRNLRRLCLHECKGGDLLCGQLALRGSTLAFLTLLDSRTLTNLGLQQLSKMASLKKLHLRNCTSVDDVGLQFLAEGRSKIVEIDLDSLDVSEVGMQQLAGLTELQNVTLHKCQRVGDAGLAHLAEGGAKIKLLKFYNVAPITDAGIVHVARMVKLRTLHLHSIRISDDGVRSFVDSGIVELSIEGLSDSGLGHLAGMRNLRDLTLDKCPRVTDAGLTNLGVCQLSRLQLGKSVGGTLTNIARVMPRLRHLQLHDRHLDNGGLAEAAHSMRHLESLMVNEQNRLGDLMELRAKDAKI